MCIPSIRCGLPCCSSQEDRQTKCSLITRIIAIGIGAIALVVGVFILTDLFGLHSLGTTTGIALTVSGGVIFLAGISFKCSQKSRGDRVISQDKKAVAQDRVIPDSKRTKPKTSHRNIDQNKEITSKSDSGELDAQIENKPKIKIPECFSPQKFQTDSYYRTDSLRNNSWISDNSEQNKELIQSIDKSEFWYIQYDQLPYPIQQDFYDVLKKDYQKASKFYSEKLSDSVVEILTEPDIAIYCGHSYQSREYKALSLASQEKVLKSILENYDQIPDPIPRNVDGFICQMLQATKDLDPQERQKVFQKTFDLLMEKFNLEEFLKKFLNWRASGDTILLKEFPLFYTKEALSRPDCERLILAMFLPGGFAGLNVSLLEDVAPELTQPQKNTLKQIFTKNNQASRCAFHLKFLK